MPFTGTTLDNLNNFVRDLPLDSGLVTPDSILDAPLLEALRPRLNTKEFTAGGKVQIYIETERPLTGVPAYEDADIVLPKDTTGVLAEVELRELQVNAGLTKQALDRVVGMPGSWANMVRRTLEQRSEDWNWLLNWVLLGNGSGALAVVDGAPSLVGSTLTVTCDNTYSDFGWENVALLQKGMEIEAYTAAEAQCTDTAGNTHWEVTGVTFGDRKNGAATSGTFTITTDSGCSIANDSTIYIYRAKSSGITGPVPVGLLGHVQDGSHYSGVAQLATFQGLTRADYSSLKARVYDAADFATGGVLGTPDDWSLTVISDAFSDCKRGSGKGYPDLLLCGSDLAMAITRRQRAEWGVNVAITQPRGEGDGRVVAGSRFAGTFIAPDGTEVPIVVADTIPENVLYGINTEDLVWHVRGGFRNYAPEFGLSAQAGDVWMKSPGDRKMNFEAPYGGYMQVTGRRCDRHFVIMDMATNI
jgi:hypothetical protein